MTIRSLCLAAIAIALVGGLTLPVVAQQSSNYTQALAAITDTADKICQSAPLEHNSNGVTLSGDANAKLGGVINKLADLGISGKGQYDSVHSSGVLQEDIIKAIQEGNNCKLEVFRALERDLIQNGSPPHSSNLPTSYPAPGSNRSFGSLVGLPSCHVSPSALPAGTPRTLCSNENGPLGPLGSACTCPRFGGADGRQVVGVYPGVVEPICIVGTPGCN